jgi:hypothetical protein
VGAETVGAQTSGGSRAPDACPDDLPRACNRIWRYLEMLGIEACERGQITLELLDRAMESTLAEGGHLTPAAMDALTAWLAKRQHASTAVPSPCDDTANLGLFAHPPPCRQTMAPERRSGRGAWRRRPQAHEPLGRRDAGGPRP